jgi:valyl-tRNA synthetase
MQVRLNQWIEGLKEDWCISRQRYSGVPFPVWYVADDMESPIKGQITAKPNDLPVDPLNEIPSYFEIGESFSNYSSSQGHYCIAKEDVYDLDGNLLVKKGSSAFLIPDRDIMDTWATSSVTPQINAGGINKLSAVSFRLSGEKAESRKLKAESRFEKLFPADLRPQAHEIIRTWAFYTIVKAHLHADSVPWRNLMISGWCLAADKTKMSKSKGNVVTPVELIREKGADTVRYWASTSRLGADTAFSEDLLKIGKKLVTKLWNASTFVSYQLEPWKNIPESNLPKQDQITETLDRWIVSRLHYTVEKATLAFLNYEYADARVAVEEFFWKDFCDNYLELIKGRAYGPSDEELNSPGNTFVGNSSVYVALRTCLNAILRLFAPFVPHVTEELFSHLFEGQGSVHARGMWPKAEDYLTDEKAESAGTACISVLNAIRKAKSERNVSIKFPITELKIGADDPSLLPLLEATLGDLKSAGNVANIAFTENLPEGISTEDGKFRLHITFAEAADAA